MMKDYDVIISGGAMTGASLALALSVYSEGNLRIAIIEKQAFKHHQQSGFDARSIALSHGSLQRLKSLGILKKLSPYLCLIHHIHVSDLGHFGLTEFSSQELQVNELGAVVELTKMGEVLLDQLNAYPNVSYFDNEIIVDVKQHSEYVVIQTKKQGLQAPLLIGADGCHSFIAQKVGIHYNLLSDYQQNAIIANIAIEQPHQNKAFERFTSQGPIALLPMCNNLLSLVWCCHPQRSNELLALDEASFLFQLQQHFGWRYGKFQRCSTRHVYPLKLLRAQQIIHHRIALAGNASQMLHPIAGQGFNLGIRDVITLANIIVDAYYAKQDIGSYTVLRKYQQARLPDQDTMVHLTDKLVSLFTSKQPLFTLGRNIGLNAFSQSHLIRQYFSQPTLGWV